MKNSLSILILAAGQGKRMGGDLPKVCVKTDEGPLIHHVLKTCEALLPKQTILVTGYKKELVEACVNEKKWDINLEFSVQDKQLGTGDAVKSGLKNISSENTLILYGDVPLISQKTLERLILSQSDLKTDITFLTAIHDQENSYGRILRDNNGNPIKIIETKDCSSHELQIKEVNLGIYLCKSTVLKTLVGEIKNNNSQQEYYLTDIVELAAKNKLTIEALTISDISESEGVNDLFDLHKANQTLLNKRINTHIKNGVTFKLPETSFIAPEVVIKSGTVIGPNTQIFGITSIGMNCIIEGTSVIINSEINDNVFLKLGTRIEDAVLHNNVAVGPFAHIRPGSIIHEAVKIGNFVETKKAILHKGVKAGHLSYLGDCQIGEETNIGAGTITCNYDGKNKFKTEIGKNVFVGSDACLVAPVKIGDNAYIGAGSVITKEVPASSLAIARGLQVNKADWIKK